MGGCSSFFGSGLEDSHILSLGLLPIAGAAGL